MRLGEEGKLSDDLPCVQCAALNVKRRISEGLQEAPK